MPTGSAPDPGFDAKCIARWDAVPYDTITQPLHVGVIAFHINGIASVDFSINGGPWTKVEQMTLNPQTDLWEYTVTIDPALLSDGLHEVRAIARPNSAGLARVLDGPVNIDSLDTGEHSLWISTNAGGTLPSVELYVSPAGDDTTGDGSESSPLRTIAKAAMVGQSRTGTSTADGVTIYLMPGDHSWGPASYDQNNAYIGTPATESRFLTVARAPTAAPGSVKITQNKGAGVKTALVCLRDLTTNVPIDNATHAGQTSIVWADGVDFAGSGRTHDIHWLGGGSWRGVFVTESQVTNSRYGFPGSSNLVRNVLIEGTGDDAFSNPRVLANVTVRDIKIPAGTGYHSDVVQYFATPTEPPPHNRIVYNLVALDCNAQGGHFGYVLHEKGPLWSDIALVNMIIDASYAMQWAPSANHMLWWNITAPDEKVMIRDNATAGLGKGEPSIITNFSMRGCMFTQFELRSNGHPPFESDPSWARDNWFIDTTSFGTTSVGFPKHIGGTHTQLFANPGARDFAPAPSSPLRGKGSKVVPADVFGNPFPTNGKAAIGAAHDAKPSNGGQ